MLSNTVLKMLRQKTIASRIMNHINQRFLLQHKHTGFNQFLYGDIQWRRLRGAWGTCPLLLQMAGHGAPWVEEQQTRNWPDCIVTITKALTETTTL